MDTTTIGVDVAKSVFQVSLANRSGRILSRKRLSRSGFERFLCEQPEADIVLEACATAHHWARAAQGYGHHPKLLHAQYVRPYVRRNKTDAADADALLRAVRDPDLRAVPIKSVDQQALQGLHRIRSQWVDTRRQRICLARRLLAEFGVHLPVGTAGIVPRLRQALDQAPAVLTHSLESVLEEIRDLESRLRDIDRQLGQIVKHDPVAQRLLTIPGIGVITASALIGSVPDIYAFHRSRTFSAWLGLTPREYSSGQSRRLGGISKRGDRYLRMLLTHGARSALLTAHRQAAKDPGGLSGLQRWVLEVEQRSHHNKATIALANKLGRIVWSVWTREENYRVR
ncbi:MAG: IS110 family transposase [Pseudomonadales bacterium]